MPSWLSVVMDDLEEIVLGIFEDHEDAFVFEYDFDEADHIRVAQFGTQSHLSDGRLGYAGVLGLFPLFV